MRRAYSGAALAVAWAIAIAGGVAPASAQDNAQLNATCSRAQGDPSINACTRLINAGIYNGRNLATSIIRAA